MSFLVTSLAEGMLPRVRAPTSPFRARSGERIRCHIPRCLHVADLDSGCCFGPFSRESALFAKIGEHTITCPFELSPFHLSGPQENFSFSRVLWISRRDLVQPLKDGALPVLELAARASRLPPAIKSLCTFLLKRSFSS